MLHCWLSAVRPCHPRAAAFNGSCPCSGRVPQSRPRHGTGLGTAQARARMIPGRTVLGPCFSGPGQCRPVGLGPFGQLYPRVERAEARPPAGVRLGSPPPDGVPCQVPGPAGGPTASLLSLSLSLSRASGSGPTCSHPGSPPSVAFTSSRSAWKTTAPRVK